MAKQTFTTGQVLTAAQMQSLQQTAMGGGSPSTKTASYVLTAADAGTVIQMNSASATTITVNTSLFAAGDSVQIQNIGAGVCTITAGTATVNSAGTLGVTQYDGGFLYFSSTSSAIWFDYTQAGTALPLTTKGDLFGYSTTNARIPVGADATVLTADSTEALGVKWSTPAAGMTNPLTTTGDTIYSSSGSTPARLGIGSTNQVLAVSAGGIPNWVTPASGGGMTLLSTTSLSGASTTISSISGSYKQLTAYIYGVTNQSSIGTFRIAPNNDTSITAQFTNFGEDTTVARYQNDYLFLSGSGASTCYRRTYSDNFLTLNIFNYAGGQQTKGFNLTGSYMAADFARHGMFSSGGIYTTSAITSLVFSNGGGNFDGGTVLLYGVN